MANDGFQYTGNNNHSCGTCGKKGYFRAGLCVQCRPKCTVCVKPILRYRGQKIHPKCKPKIKNPDGDLLPVIHGC